MTEEDGFEWDRFTAEILYGVDRDDWDKMRFEAHRMCMYTHDAMWGVFKAFEILLGGKTLR